MEGGGTKSRSVPEARDADRFHRWLALIVGANVVARLIWIAASASVPLEGATDQMSYVRLGEKLAEGHRYTAFGAPPLYPVLIGVVVKVQGLLGASDVSLRASLGLVHVLLGSGSIAALALLTRRLVRRSRYSHLADRAGLVTAVWLALWVNQVLSTSVLLTERLATPLFVALVTCLLWDDELTTGRLVAVGVLGPLLLLTRPAYACTVAVAWLFIVVRSPSWREGLRRGLVVVGATLVVLAPWWAYTASQAGGPLLTGSTSGSFNLCLGNNDGATGGWSEAAIAADECQGAWSGSEAAAGDAAMRSQALSWMVAHPGRQPHLVAERIRLILAGDADALSWLPTPQDYDGPGTQSVLRAWSDAWGWINLWLFVPGTVAMAVVLRRSAGWLMALGASTLVAPLISVGDPRYHEAVMALAAIGIGCLVALVAPRGRRCWQARGMAAAVAGCSR